MRKIGVKFRFVILSVIIMIAVVTSGYFANRSLRQIVDSVHNAARPDQKLMLIKEIASDLSELENNVRIFVLTGNQETLNPYQLLHHSVQNRLNVLMNTEDATQIDREVLDTIQQLVLIKLSIWEEVLSLHFSKNDLKESFSDIYASFEKQTFDTVTVEQHSKGFLRSLFGRRDTSPEYNVVTKSLEKDEIKQEIRYIETNILERSEELELKETELIQHNLEISGNLFDFITQIEQSELESLISRTNEADRLAALTYKRLLAFSITAVFLILLIIYTFFSHLKKSQAYQRMLKKSKNEAEALTRAREMFVANVSHELRTPVNAIYGLAEQASGDVIQNKELISYLLKASAHLKSIVNQTLDFSKMQTDKLSIELIDFSPAALFNEIMAIHSVDAQKKKIVLNLLQNGFLPDALLGDPMRLKQIIINLLGNAIKFTDVGSVTVQINSTLKNNLCQLEVQVIDTGIGISEENLVHIFEEFSQVDNSSSRKYSGTGLGLAIAKKLVEIQEGKIWANSQPGAGTSIGFTISYPIGDIHKIENASIGIKEIPESFNELLALVVDDEDYNRFLLCSILKKWGIEFHDASSGTEALRACMKYRFNLIFMDIRMPGMNGLDASVGILKIQPEARIIATSASNERNDIEACQHAGMQGQLLKPFTEKELFEAIIQVMGIDLNKVVMNTVLALPEIDLAELRRQANGDETFFREMIEIFIASTETGLDNMKKAVEIHDWDAVLEAAHKMAAPCKHLQALSLYALLKQLEEQAKSNVVPEDIKQLVQQIGNLLTNLNHYLRIQLRD